MSRPNGWDARDYALWSSLRSLPSFGTLAGDDRMVSLESVIKLLEEAALRRVT